MYPNKVKKEAEEGRTYVMLVDSILASTRLLIIAITCFPSSLQVGWENREEWLDHETRKPPCDQIFTLAIISGPNTPDILLQVLSS